VGSAFWNENTIFPHSIRPTAKTATPFPRCIVASKWDIYRESFMPFFQSMQNPSHAPQLSPSMPEKSSPWSRFASPAVILLAATVAVAPQMIHGPSCGHDFDFHLVSWFDCLNSWRQGILYPHWAASANFGAGEPRFVFYPPLTWMLGAALGIVLPWQLVPTALTFLLLAATGLATRALASEALTDGAATLAGCATLFSGYALFTACERTAFGELAGGFWIPLLLLFALRNRNPSGKLWQQVLDGSASPLALAVAGCWLSNVPVGIMGCYLLAAVAAAAALVARSWAPLLRACIAAVAGIGLASIYLLPAAWEQRSVDIRQITDDPGEKIESSWLFARHADPSLAAHDTVLLKVSAIAATMLAVALVSLLILWMRGRLSIEKQPILRSYWLPLALIPLAVLFLQTPISLPVWNLLPKMHLLQFPWRWLVVLEAPVAVFFAAALWPRAQKFWQRSAISLLCVAFFLAATAFAARDFFQTCDEQDAVSGMVNVFQRGAGFLGSDEYAPPGSDNTIIATGLPSACLVSDASTVLGALPDGVVEDDANPAWSAEQATCEATLSWQLDQPEHKRIQAALPHPGFLILRLRSYPAWRIAVNGRTVASLPRRDDGLIAIPAPQGPVDLTVDWKTATDTIAGRWLSTLSVFSLTGLWFVERKLRQPHLS
jgi:hypothetical protein